MHPCIPQVRQGGRPFIKRRHGMTMIVIYGVVAVPVHSPEKIFLKPVRMPVLGDHLDVLLQRVGDPGNMRDGWKD